MKEQKKIEALKEKMDLHPVSPDRFANKFLSKRLWQYQNMRINHCDDKFTTIADVFHNIYNFRFEVDETLRNLITELVKGLGNKPGNVYIPNKELKIVIFEVSSNEDEEPKFGATVEHMETAKDWEEALVQEKEKLKRIQKRS